MSAQDIVTGAVASLYRLTDELPASQRLEAIEYVRRVESRLAHLEEGIRRIEEAANNDKPFGQIAYIARSLLADQDGAA